MRSECQLEKDDVKAIGTVAKKDYSQENCLSKSRRTDNNRIAPIGAVAAQYFCILPFSQTVGGALISSCSEFSKTYSCLLIVKGRTKHIYYRSQFFYRELVPYRCDQKEEIVGWEVREKMASW